MSIQVFQIRQGDEHLSSHSGLGLVGALLARTSINKRVNPIPIVDAPPISNAPIFSYLGGEGYLVNAELREGSQHCQNGTPKYLEDSITYARHITDRPILVRMDSGNDCKENMKICSRRGISYIIKRNLRKESVEDWVRLVLRGMIGIPEGEKCVPQHLCKYYVTDSGLFLHG